MAEDEIGGWYQSLDRPEFKQAIGNGHENLMCYSPWGYKESDTTVRLN